MATVDNLCKRDRTQGKLLLTEDVKSQRSPIHLCELSAAKMNLTDRQWILYEHATNCDFQCDEWMSCFLQDMKRPLCHCKYFFVHDLKNGKKDNFPEKHVWKPQKSNLKKNPSDTSRQNQWISLHFLPISQTISNVWRLVSLSVFWPWWTRSGNNPLPGRPTNLC